MPAETAATEPTKEEHMATQPDRCRRGHEYTPDNTLTHHGRRSCRACDRAAATRGGGRTPTTPPPDVLPLGWHRRNDTPAAREAARLFAQATQWRAES